MIQSPKPVDWQDHRHNRSKYATEAERAAGLRQRRINRNRRYRANLRARLMVSNVCQHGCGCDNPMQSICGMCRAGLCDE